MSLDVTSFKFSLYIDDYANKLRLRRRFS